MKKPIFTLLLCTGVFSWETKNSGVFIFGDKYATNNDEATIKLFVNTFAWAIRNASCLQVSHNESWKPLSFGSLC
ncbi:MAG: hypothetical protein ACK5L7_08995 [Paludibacteraceae bacterium]